MQGAIFSLLGKELNVYDDPAVNGRIAACLMHSGFYNKSKEYYMEQFLLRASCPITLDLVRSMIMHRVLFVEESHEEAYVFLNTMAKIPL